MKLICGSEWPNFYAAFYQIFSHSLSSFFRAEMIIKNGCWDVEKPNVDTLKNIVLNKISNWYLSKNWYREKVERVLIDVGNYF